MFLFARLLPHLGISAILYYIGGVRAQTPLKKGYFKDVESVRKTLDIFNLTITNPMLVKLITMMHLHKSVNRIVLEPETHFLASFNCITGEAFV